MTIPGGVCIKSRRSGLRLLACNFPASAKWVLTAMSEIREKYQEEYLAAFRGATPTSGGLACNGCR